MKKVESSNIQAVGYDSDTKIMTIRFRDGGVYQYANVPEKAYKDLLNADSVGSHFHKHVKTKFPYRKV